MRIGLLLISLGEDIMKFNEPKFIYGTAWKENDTERLTEQALFSGFRAIDTANQRKHYYEEAVGRGIYNFLVKSGKERSGLFLQTKFTYERGQDHQLPYVPSAALREQVFQSFASSLKHLQTDYLDSFLLHGPISSLGIHLEDMEAWSAMEELYEQKKVKALGIANCSLSQLQQLYVNSMVKPVYIQNRCFAQLKWDYAVRAYCREKGIKYQGFSLLTANSKEITKDAIVEIAQKYKKTIPQITFRFCHQLGIICLTGTSNKEHMIDDLNIHSFALTPNEMHLIEQIGI